MRYSLAVGWAISCLACLCGTSRAATPELFQSHRFNAAMIAYAVNHFIGIGEKASIAELAALATSDANSWLFARPMDGDEMAQRVAWMCLILWPAKPGQVQRPPGYGVLLELDGHLSIKDWPVYPLAWSGHSYFVLGTEYAVGGHPEHPRDYLANCESKGIFRKVPVPVPTRTQAQLDASTLRQSRPWQAGWSFDHAAQSDLELKEWPFIKAQADTIESSQAIHPATD